MDVGYVLESLLIFNPIEALSILLAIYIIYGEKIDLKIIKHGYGLGSLCLLIQLFPFVFDSIPILYTIATLLSCMFACVIFYLYFHAILNIKINIRTILTILISIFVGTMIVIGIFNIIDINVYDFAKKNLLTSLFVILIIKTSTFLSIIIINKIITFFKGCNIYQKFIN